MAEAFLRQLLRADSRAPSDEQHKCIICMEECGVMNPDTGLVELAIRLPVCGHVVGSACIAQWLQSGNTCPLCRHVFFPAPARPYLEHGVMEGQADRVPTNAARTARDRILTGPIAGVIDFLEELGRLGDACCARLSLRRDVARIARYVLANLLEPGPCGLVLEDRSNDCVVAVSIYISAHLASDSRSPREIAAVMDGGGVGASLICDVYNSLIGQRALVADGIRADVSEILDTETLLWPPDGDEMTPRESRLERLVVLCADYCDRLRLPGPVRTMTCRVASRACNACPRAQTAHSVESIAAACVYMAAHLMRSSRHLSGLSRISSVSDGDVSRVYRLLFAKRERIVQDGWLRDIGTDEMESALALLPAV